MDLARLVEKGEAEAYRDMFRAAPAPMAEALGLEIFDIEGAVGLMVRKIDAPEFNRVMGLGLERPATPQALDRIVQLYRPLGLKFARLQLSPQAAPKDALAGWLAERDLAPSPLSWTKRARDTETLPDTETDLTIVEAQAAPGQFGATACAGFGMPPMLAPWLDALVGRPDWRCFVAMDGEAAAGAAALFLGEDYGWLGIGATRPEARGRGGQGALMRRRIEAAAKAGKSCVVTETGAPLPGEAPGPSYRNMDRHGFVEVHARPNYVI